MMFEKFYIKSVFQNTSEKKLYIAYTIHQQVDT